MKNGNNTAQNLPVANAEKQNELKNGLAIIELEERLEMAQLTAAAAASLRCDSSGTE